MKSKFETLKPWINEILNCIKKDIKQDYLPSDKVFCRTYFGNRPLNRLSTEEIFEAIEKELIRGSERLEEWVVNRWVFQHGDIYSYFESRLKEIQEDFSNLNELSVERGNEILKESGHFSPVDLYLFSILNGVVFPQSILDDLRAKAEVASKELLVKMKEESENRSLIQTIEHQKREIARLQEKFESKIEGVLKKYTTDTEALKKQIRSLQEQLKK